MPWLVIDELKESIGSLARRALLPDRLDVTKLVQNPVVERAHPKSIKIQSRNDPLTEANYIRHYKAN